MHLLWPVIAVQLDFLGRKSMASLARSADVRLRSRPISQRGCGKRSNAEFQRFLHIAAGSASELEYHFLLAKDLGFLADEEYKKLDQFTVEVKRMLAGLIKKVEADRRGTEC
jgi:hypothetical protein